MGCPGRQVHGRIITVTQAGDVPAALLGFDDASGAPDPVLRSWVDFHTLPRVNGVWKITNKTATHATRWAWAADRQLQHERASIA